MKHPNFSEERKLHKLGYKRIVGLDEAGRGALSGPVVAAAVMIEISNFQFPISKQFPISNFQFSKIKDSKKLSPKQREIFYKIITRVPFIKWGIGRVSEKVIDRINILEATKLAMKKAVKKIIPNSQFPIPKRIFLILDGNMKLNLKVPQKSIVKADEKVISCAVASIIAKVYRDRIMRKYNKKYPQYNFVQHKGYGTKEHFKMLKKYGPCKIHRRSFKPIKNLRAYSLDTQKLVS